MFKGKTVFILGAGASNPYGFPLGYKLVTDILDNLTDTSKFNILYRVVTEFRGHVGFNDDIKGFQNSLSMAPAANSIDDYLEYHKNYLLIGKAAIAQAIIPCEKQEILLARNSENDWYRLIFNTLRENIDKLEEAQISFITFNYDRSLEHYLFIQLKEYLGFNKEMCIKVMANIPIIHVYGHIGNLNWQSKTTGAVRKYEQTVDTRAIMMAIDNLWVIHEGDKVQNNFEEAQRLIQQCTKIRFLGYGFHDTNTERLNLVGNAKGKNIYATAYGLSQLEKDRITRHFGVTIGMDEAENRDIVRFFREWVPLE